LTLVVCRSAAVSDVELLRKPRSTPTSTAADRSVRSTSSIAPRSMTNCCHL